MTEQVGKKEHDRELHRRPTMWFASCLCEKGIITGGQFAEAVREQLSRRPILGLLAMREGKLTMKQSREILSAQADAMEKPFGQLAVELGFLTREELVHLVVEHGYGKETIQMFQAAFDTIIADRVRHTATGFWEKMGFDPDRNGHYVWTRRS